MNKETTQFLIKKAGGPYQVAKLITEQFGKITPQAISQWEMVPPRRAVQIETVTKGRVTKHDLRPDLFGENKNVA